MLSESGRRIVAEDIAAIVERQLPWEELSGCKILITGAGGFLGGYITRLLLSLYRLGKVKDPVRVAAVVRSIAGAKERLKDAIEDRNLELIEWDLNRIAVPSIPNCNFVIHAGSHASPKYYGGDPVGTILPNSIGTAALLNMLETQSSDARGFLFISSSEIYGHRKEQTTIAEADYGIIDPALLRSCYGESKRLGEALCIAWSHQYKTPTFIVRPFHTYGPGILFQDGRVFADFVANVVRNEKLTINSTGAARRAYCYASDAIAGIMTVLLKGVPATPYNVANPAGELSVLELAELLVRLFPQKELQIERCPAPETMNYLASSVDSLIPDINRIAQLGWTPEISPAEGFRRMVEANNI